MVQRVVAALVMRETDPARSPFRRIAGSTLVGVLLAALALGGVAAYSVINPGGSVAWRDESAVIVEKETGAIYVYRDHLLHPVLNYTSALLVLGTPSVKSISASRASLADAPRGAAWGIADAPASLPAADRLTRAAWTVCSSQGRSTLFVGGYTGGAGPGDHGLLVAGDTDTYLLWRGHKHLVRDADAVLADLVWNNRTPLPVAGGFLNAVPAGTDLARPVITGRGRSAASPPGAKIGQVYAVKRDQGGADFFIATADRLASLTPLQADLLLADPAFGQRQAIDLPRLDFARDTQGTTVAPFAADAGGAGALPVTVPELVEPGNVCVAGDALFIKVTIPDLPGAVSTSPSASVLADRIVVPPGRGALIRSSTGGLSLVTDAGKRFAIPSDDLLPALGYASAQPMTLAPELVALIPAGPSLDPAVAKH
jgi:type VII secretion protein EccB